MPALLKAALLIGPTGSGKTPLGDHMAATGVDGRPCAHFDFGEQLRRAASLPADYPLLSDADIQTIKGSLETGLLLENHQLHIAEDILRGFIQQNELDENTLILLNGLPRHEGQADRLDGIVTVAVVIYLRCTEMVVYERIQSNSGGDRTERVDDSRAKVAAKLAIFKERTEPLLNFYRNRGIPICPVDVEVHSRPEQLVRMLNFY